MRTMQTIGNRMVKGSPGWRFAADGSPARARGMSGFDKDQSGGL